MANHALGKSMDSEAKLQDFYTARSIHFETSLIPTKE
jgi:hypothetical protein